MNQPSRLALAQSSLLQSRLGIFALLFALLAVLGGGFYLLFARHLAPPQTPTVATSPAATARPRPVVKPPALVVYGPPAPDWVERVPLPAEVSSATPATAVPAGPTSAAVAITMPGVATPTAPVVSAVPPVAPSQMSPPAPPGASAASPAVVSQVPPPAAPVASVASPAAPTSVPPPGTPVTTESAAGFAAPVATQPVAGPGSAAAPLPNSATPLAVAGVPAISGEIPRSLDESALLAREKYVYTSVGRRDPFMSLVDGKYQSQSGEAALVDVGDIHLVGIMWGSSDKFALVEDSRKRGFVLRVGDPVVNGYISGITKNEVQVVQNSFGDTQMLSIQLKPKEGDKNATQN